MNSFYTIHSLSKLEKHTVAMVTVYMPMKKSY